VEMRRQSRAANAISIAVPAGPLWLRIVPAICSTRPRTIRLPSPELVWMFEPAGSPLPSSAKLR
jgi:hypothetical protein